MSRVRRNGLTQDDRNWIAGAIRDGLKPVEGRLDRIEGHLEGVRNAMLIMAQHLPGSVPERDSHVARKIRRALGGSWKVGAEAAAEAAE
ncbi:MAG: hypothetical protein OXG58_06285 [Gemmatimonadetes bacterium]|nr:hypothetical protein [Gemmatimonadota bacterium]MCY3944155.1 hypothetical protein [Gemmatimonadota bacterium]